MQQQIWLVCLHIEFPWLLQHFSTYNSYIKMKYQQKSWKEEVDKVGYIREKFKYRS